MLLHFAAAISPTNTTSTQCPIATWDIPYAPATIKLPWSLECKLLIASLLQLVWQYDFLLSILRASALRHEEEARAYCLYRRGLRNMITLFCRASIPLLAMQGFTSDFPAVYNPPQETLICVILHSHFDAGVYKKLWVWRMVMKSGGFC